MQWVELIMNNPSPTESLAIVIHMYIYSRVHIVQWAELIMNTPSPTEYLAIVIYMYMDVSTLRSGWS